MAQLDELLARLEHCELEAQAARGYIKALEYGLHTLIATSPNPSDIQLLWAHVLAAVPDHFSGEATPLYDAAFQQAMAKITEEIDGAASR